MKIRNVFFSMIVALATVPAYATAAAATEPAPTAQSVYEREAQALERKLDQVDAGMAALDGKVKPETARTLHLQLAVLKARHDVALGRLLAEKAKQAP
ncbi:MAG: hypothetical protein M0O99_07835 [Desulfuromonas thiophila]|jgi:hypothetical protein|nr:hypothetical protein [Desulfuromonas thiophila]MDY0251406.1 hypothetical protein [Pseudomonas sp.]